MSGLLTGSLVIDLGHGSTEADRREVARAGLDQAPAGTRVVLLVSSRRPPVDQWVLETLRTATRNLVIDIRANDGGTLSDWHGVIGGDL